VKFYCVDCKAEITRFKDRLSEKEFAISGLCQKCQDEVFNEEELEVPADEWDDGAA
jgi:hypothetical protein